MKVKIIFFTFLLFFCVDKVIIIGQWQKINPPNGGNISSIAISHDNIFALAANKIFNSTNNGTYWNSIVTQENFYNDELKIITSGNSVLYTIDVLGYIYKSTDKGKSWSFIHDTHCAQDLITDGSNIMVAQWCSGGVDISNNYGESWHTAFEGTSIRFATICDGVFFIKTNDDEIYYSEDNGHNWINLQLPIIPEYHFISGLVKSDSKILISVRHNWRNPYPGILFKTDNNGTSWEAVENTSLTEVNELIKNEDVLYALNWNGNSTELYSSHDLGINWTLLTKEINCSVNSVAFKGSDVFIATRNGVFSSSDNGVNWISINQGLYGHKLFSMSSSGDKLLLGTSSGLFTSIDHGSSWEPTSFNSMIKKVKCIDSVYYVLSGSMLNFSKNSGGNWDILVDEVMDFDVHNQTIVVCGGSSGSYFSKISTDAGQSWKGLGVPISSCDNWMADQYVYNVFLKNDTIFANPSCGGIKMSIDDGDSWINLENELPILCDRFTSNNQFIFATDGINIYISENGLNWNLSISGLPGYSNNYYDRYILTFHEYNDSIFLATEKGVYLFDNKLLSWEKYNDGLEENIEPIFLVSNNCCLFLGEKTGKIWRYIIDENYYNMSTSGKNNDIIIYPNPSTNDKIFIKNIPETGVLVEVMDSNGRKVISENINRGKLSLHGLSAGLYLVKVYFEGKTYSSKIVVQ